MQAKVFILALAAVAGHVHGQHGKWSCVSEDTELSHFKYGNTSGPFKVGDCLVLKNATAVTSMPLGSRAFMYLAADTAFPENTVGNFLFDTRCLGLRLTSTEQQPPPIVCPVGGLAVNIPDDTPFPTSPPSPAPPTPAPTTAPPGFEWTCAKRVNVTAKLSNTSAPFGVGDCITITDAKVFANMTSASPTQIKMRMPDRTGFGKGVFGDFAVDASCQGFRLQNVSEAPPGSKMDKPSITCLDDEVAALKGAATPMNACTHKYAKLDKYGNPDQWWEQEGLLCYPVCEPNYYGTPLGMCYAACAWGDSLGISCTRDTYQPSSRAKWPWQDCDADEYSLFWSGAGFVCFKNCKVGYSRYWVGLLPPAGDYLCASDCPPNTQDNGVDFCGKRWYARTPGGLAVPVGELVGIVLGTVVAAGLLVMGGVALAPYLLDEIPEIVVAAELEVDAAAAADEYTYIAAVEADEFGNGGRFGGRVLTSWLLNLT